jgi:hypothetical protein
MLVEFVCMGSACNHCSVLYQAAPRSLFTIAIQHSPAPLDQVCLCISGLLRRHTCS